MDDVFTGPRTARLPGRARWLTALAVGAVAAVNLAGIWDIALARRTAAEDATRAFAAETAGRARALEQTLADLRSNLTFLAASSPVSQLTRAETPEARFRREAAESALLVSLRSHPSVVRLAVREASGQPLLLVGRRGGLPVLWVSGAPTGDEGAAADPNRPRVLASIAADPSATAGNHLDVEIAPLVLLGPHESERSCRLQDAQGTVMARHARAPGADERRLDAAAEVRAEGWSAPGPWSVACTEPVRVAVASTEPLAARQRTTLALNLGVMALAVLLGGLRAARGPAARAPGGGSARGGARARPGAPALPRGAADDGRPAGGRHRPRDQQPARGNGELPVARPGGAGRGRHRGRRAPARRRAPGARAGGGHGAPGADAVGARRRASGPGGRQPHPGRRRRVHPLAPRVRLDPLRDRPRRGPAAGARERGDAGPGRVEPAPERVRSPARGRHRGRASRAATAAGW